MKTMKGNILLPILTARHTLRLAFAVHPFWFAIHHGISRFRYSASHPEDDSRADV
jgi:hypothetical protein